MNIERTLDDASPAIMYNGTWETTADPDSNAPGDQKEYYRDTLHRSYTAGDTISFAFQGNGAYFIGTTGPNNGNYTVQFDGGAEEMFTANSPSRRSRQMLYTRGNTGPGNHQVVFKNVPLPNDDGSGNSTRNRLDLDMIQIVSIEVGDITTTAIDDTDPTLEYSGGGWTLETATDKGFRNGTAHNSNQVGAGVTIPFKGTSIAVYGSVDAIRGGFQVSLDAGMAGETYISYRPDYMSDVLLYTVAELPNTDHTLYIGNMAYSGRTAINFDYAVVNYTTPTDGAAPNFQPGAEQGDGSTGAGSGTGAQHGGESGSNGAVIGGAVGGGVVGALLLAALLWFFCCRRKGTGDDEDLGKGQGDRSAFAAMFGLGSRKKADGSKERTYELEKADGSVEHIHPGYVDRRPSSNVDSSPGGGGRRMSIDSPPHLTSSSQLHLQTPRTQYTDATLINSIHHPAILDDVPANKPVVGYNPAREGSVSEGSLYSQTGQTHMNTLNTDGLTAEQRDSLLAAVRANPNLLNGGTGTGLSGGNGSYFAPSIAASSGVMPAYGRGMPAGGRNMAAPSSAAVPSPLQTRHAPGFGRPTSPGMGDGAESTAGTSQADGLPFVLDIGGAAARVRAQQRRGPGSLPRGVGPAGTEAGDASTVFPQSVDGGSIAGDLPMPMGGVHAFMEHARDRTPLTPPQSGNTAYTGLGPNTPQSATRGLMSGFNSNEKGTSNSSPLASTPYGALPRINVPATGEGDSEHGRTLPPHTPGYVRDHKIPTVMIGEDGQAVGSRTGSRNASHGGSDAAGPSGIERALEPAASIRDSGAPSGSSRSPSRFSIAFGSREEYEAAGDVPPDYAHVLAESQHGSLNKSRREM